MRKIEFANKEYYHIYNRGVDKREVFCEEKDFLRFLKSMREFNNKSSDSQRDYEKRKFEKKKEENLNLGKLSFGYPKLSFKFLSMPKLVKIICYCLNPNHYHLLVKQLVDDGISRFMHKINIGYSKYFNQKYERAGSLFQGPFQATHTDTNKYLLWLSGYVNGNAEIHKIAKAENYKWCGYPDYLGKRNGTLCDKKIILSQFRNVEEYKKFVEMVIAESRKRKDLKKYFME